MKTRSALAAALLLGSIGVTATVLQRPAARDDARPAPRAATKAPIPAQYDDPTFFLSPIMQAKGGTSARAVTGITVPHHLLARDLIAGAFRYAAAAKPTQVLLIGPDHFDLGDTDVSVAERDLATAFGVLRTDAAAVRKLEALPSVHAQTFFYREHGLQAELPFIRHHFPDAKIIALTFKESTPKETLDRVVAILEETLDRGAFVVQSTDFSHYLPAAQADAMDRETIAALENGDAAALLALGQPSHMDSTAAQYVQTRLQEEFFGSTLKILAHRNSQAYAKAPVDSTTSYIVQAYEKGE
ncbi:MAG: hypothetical protein RL272_203 [Candidatus Parcubacteria bacterium]